MTKWKDAELRGPQPSIRISRGCSVSQFYSFALLPRASSLFYNHYTSILGLYLIYGGNWIETSEVNPHHDYCLFYVVGFPELVTQCFCRAFNMPKANSRQVQGPRIPAGEYDYATWTVTRLRQELNKYDVRPGSWIKKSGLVSLLKTAIRQHDDRDGAPPVAHRGRTRGRRARAANEDVGNEVEASNGVRIDPLPVPQNFGMGMAEFAATIARLESSVSLLNATLLQQAPAAQPRDVISRAAQDSPPQPGHAPVTQNAGDSAPATNVTQNPLPRSGSGPEMSTGVPPTDSWQQSSVDTVCQEKWSTLIPAPSSAAPATNTPGLPGAIPPAAGRPGAVPADSLPRIDLVSPQLRQDILAGKDVNLAALLIPGYKGPGEYEQRSLMIGEKIIPLKPLTDPRVTKALTISEFIKAFSIYKNVMCEGFPEREKELSAYLADIVEMATRFSGLTFYEYHREFSAKSATWHARGVELDWSKRDTALFTFLFSGLKANACAICGSLGHQTSFCSLANDSKKSEAKGRRSNDQTSDRNNVPRVYFQGKEICNNFNFSRGCPYNPCKRSHVCLNCHASHPRFQCNVDKSLAKRPSTTERAKSGTSTKWLTQLEQTYGQDVYESNLPSTDIDMNNDASTLPGEITPSPPSVNTEYLELLLQEHPDRNFVNSLLTGLRSGFHTGLLQIPDMSFECKNNLSARRDPSTVKSCLDSEVNKGYMIGPFQTPPFDCYRTSPLGLAERKYSDKKRLILDLSAPYDNDEIFSMNGVINKEDYSLSYVKIDDAIRIIKSLGPKAWLSKTDMVDAFKQIPINPSLWPFYGAKWQGEYYFYTRLAFGSRSSPKIFDMLSSAITWVLQHKFQLSHTLHLLDDFLVINHPNDDADRSMAIITMVFNRLRLPIAPHKTVGPTHALEYLGITLDTIATEARLPENKLDRLRIMIEKFVGQSSCTQRQLFQLLGHLNFAARVIVPGRTFMSRLFRAAYKVKQLHHKVFLDESCKEDLKMWAHFLEHWNGISLFLDESETLAADMDLFTDASGTIGFGGFFQGQWFSSAWPDDIDSLLDKDAISIAFQELYPIVIAAILWGHLWSRKRLLFHCDNKSTVYVLNKGNSHCPDIMKLMRRLVLLAGQHSFSYRAVHIPGDKNCLADSLSRLQIARFHRLAPPGTAPKPCTLPSEVTFN